MSECPAISSVRKDRFSCTYMFIILPIEPLSAHKAACMSLSVYSMTSTIPTSIGSTNSFKSSYLPGAMWPLLSRMSNISIADL